MTNNMLHMKLNYSASAIILVVAAGVFSLPSSAQAGVCFLPDCQDTDAMSGNINMNTNADSKYCEKEGFTYYALAQCPQYHSVTGICSRDEHYLKCDEVKWCKDNGYATTSCSLPKFLDISCPNGQPYFKQCTTDNPRACREAGYTNTCPSGQKLKKTSGRCSWDSSYGTCCAPKSCPSQYALAPTCNKMPTNGTDGCEYECYKCCSDDCPTSGTSKSYSGSSARATECGTPCYYFRSCPSGSSTSYHGSSAGYDDNGKWCGNYCSSSCSSGSSSPSCAWNEKQVYAGSSECGSCYKCQYNSDCNAYDNPCSGGWCNSNNSCGKCTSCGYPCSHGTHVSCSYGCASTCPCDGSCTSCNPPPLSCSGTTPYAVGGKCSQCRTDSDCTTNIYPGSDGIVAGAIYAKRNLPYRYYGKCSTSRGECVEALTVADCGNIVDKYAGTSEYKYGASPTTYLSSNACACFVRFVQGDDGTGISCHGDTSGGGSCAVKSCSSDADCVGFKMDGRVTYCYQASSEAGGEFWCVPKFSAPTAKCW